MIDAPEDNVWEDIFSSRPWGQYPNEELVSFVGRSLRSKSLRKLGNVVEIGCGPGANLWFLGRVSEEILGVDFSKTALTQAESLYGLMNSHRRIEAPKLVTLHADISNLVGRGSNFDYVFDVLATTHNSLEKMRQILKDVHTMLATDGTYWGKFWGIGCPGFASSERLGPYTRKNILEGPCQGVGITTFIDKALASELFSDFQSVNITRTVVEDGNENRLLETYVVIATK